MDRSGYFYAYLVNESSMNVYFDDFQVTQTTSNVLEENHYYPFGMLNTQLSTLPTENPLNHYKYNGKELQKELNLEWLDYGARFYDAQVGRWHAIDPLAEVSRRWSPYTYGYNSPTTMIDPDGMLAQSFFNDILNRSSTGTTWTNNDNGTFSNNSTGETINTDNPPQGNTKQLKTTENNQDEGSKLDYSTIGKNIPLIGGRSSYAGGNNPMTKDKDYTYQYIPTMITDYPAIGHDRRYDNLKIQGLLGLVTNTRAIGADWKFVGEELDIAMNRSINPVDRINAKILAVGLSIFATPKTIIQLAKPNGLTDIFMWYNISNVGVSNRPSK